MVFNAEQAPVFYPGEAYGKLNDFIKNNDPSIIFILVDSNTKECCLPFLIPILETERTIEVIEMEAGEENKNIETCSTIWNVLSELEADRKSLLINLGGGVVTDLGGFVASTFKRGIAYINIPTTLLAMVDASVGGKTGVDLGNLKNQVGVISQPEMVLIDSHYLKTLSASEMRSGLAEILKHGLISSKSYWKKATQLQNLTVEDLDDLIEESVKIKSKVVKQDPDEKSLRKTLNFGHTFGHAIESHFLTHPEKKPILHGEAVAAGVIIAAFLSYKLTGLPEAELKDINENILEIYSKVDIQKEDFDKILHLMKYDKKNSHGRINFVLLEQIGKPLIDCEVPSDLQLEALTYYYNLK